MTVLTMPGWKSSCFTSLLAFAFTLYHRLRPGPGCVFTNTRELEPEYDFIIVGAGSAGSVVANRLSECCEWKVLLLEAGGPETDVSGVSALSEQLRNTELDWKYKTEPPKHGQGYCLSMTGHMCNWPRGKVVGGSSVLNSMFYVRGNKHDYDNWERLGNEGWGYDDVLPYFLKSEDNSDLRLLETPYHASGSFLSVENTRYTTPLADVWLKAGHYLGYNHVDINGKTQEGFTILQGTTYRGPRCSTSKAFILSVQEKRQNLVLSWHSYVTKIGFEYEDSMLTARTVSFTKNHQKYVVRAKKEIILCAGAINTPQLLMLSGIGPNEHLNDHGITALRNLPVGYNLQDHLGSGYLTFSVDKNVTIKPRVVDNPDNVMKYLADGRGPLTALDNVIALAHINSKYANRSISYPDIQFEFSITSIFNGDEPFGFEVYNLRPDLFNGTGYQNLGDGNFFVIVANLMRPESKGQVLLRSQNPYDHPRIIPNYFDKREDVEVLVNGYQIALELTKTPPFKEYNTAPIPYPFPGCSHLKMFSNEYFECTIRHFTRTEYHPSCTCPMGVTSEAVVDPRLRVHSVKRLRVIDASAMPKIVSGNLNAPVIMMAEKGSDLIKEDWYCPNYLYDQSYECGCKSPIIKTRVLLNVCVLLTSVSSQQS